MAWAGALLVVDTMDDIRFIRGFVEAYAKAMSRPRAKRRR